jgi:trehalose-6-phosphate synthase
MEAYERFLVNNPDQRGHVTYLQIAPTSRSQVPEYDTLSRVVKIDVHLPAEYQSREAAPIIEARSRDPG